MTIELNIDLLEIEGFDARQRRLLAPALDKALQHRLTLHGPLTQVRPGQRVDLSAMDLRVPKGASVEVAADHIARSLIDFLSMRRCAIVVDEDWELGAEPQAASNNQRRFS